MHLMKVGIAIVVLVFIRVNSAFADVACAVIADARTDDIIQETGICDRRATPASTFEIAISLMGYDSGFLVDEHSPALPFREDYSD
jgi:beta-lactamase class D